jgi:hypothetical protein
MPTEREHHQQLPLKGIYIDFDERAIEFEDQHGTVGRIVFSGETVLVEGHLLTLASAPELTHEGSEPTVEPASPVAEQREKQPTTVVSGKLMSQPKEGRADNRGKPTAFARLAVHEEGRDDAHLYLATFHRHTTAIALGLRIGSPVTVEGYSHVNTDPTNKRLDTFSVINVVNYPGKPEKRSLSRGR